LLRPSRIASYCEAVEPIREAPRGSPQLLGGFTLDTLAAGLLVLFGAIVFLAVAPYTYNIYLGIHVLAAVTWVGGDITLTTLGIVFERRSEGETLGALGRMGAGSVRASTHRRSSSRLCSESRSWSRAIWTGVSSGFSSASSAG